MEELPASLADALTYPLADALTYPLVDALRGRRSRRFALGCVIPDGPLAYASRFEPLPLNEIEQLFVLSAAAGRTGWHYLLPRSERLAPAVPPFSGSAAGRTFPSGAGIHTSELFFSDDRGTFLFSTRDAPSSEADAGGGGEWLQEHRRHVRKLDEGRLDVHAPYISPQNVWCVNVPGSTVLIPVADAAQHALALLFVTVQHGGTVYDDINDRAIPGLERFAGLVDLDERWALSDMEREVASSIAAEHSMICYAGMLALQAAGLGGWFFSGMDQLTVLGAAQEVRGLGFTAEHDDRWRAPNPVGRPGVFRATCPPNYPDMRACAQAYVARQFGEGGPFNPTTPGPWKESAAVRGGARIHADDVIECVATMAQYVFDRFGRFPATLGSALATYYLQAHHLDLEFYDRHFAPGAYLPSHAEHMARWHPADPPKVRDPGPGA